jgi:hypothetical protein
MAEGILRSGLSLWKARPRGSRQKDKRLGKAGEEVHAAVTRASAGRCRR